MGFEVNGLVLDDDKLNVIISEIKKNKKYWDIENSVIERYIKRYAYKDFGRLKKEFNSLENSKFLKGCVKYVRSVLRKKSTLYLTKQALVLIDTISSKGEVSRDEVLALLETHRSTRERLDFYRKLYSIIFSFLLASSHSNKLVIGDIGCGLNPFSYIFIPKNYLKRMVFYAVDIDEKLLNAVRIFFKSFSIQGKTIFSDALDFASSFKQEFDCVLLFRLLELMDDAGHKKAEMLIRELKAKLFVASFSRRTISGKRMTLQHKPWLERMLKRLGFSFEIKAIKEEIFYFFYNSQPELNSLLG